MRAVQAVRSREAASYQPTPESRRGGAREVTTDVRGVVDVSIQGPSSPGRTRRVEFSKRREALLAKPESSNRFNSRELSASALLW